MRRWRCRFHDWDVGWYSSTASISLGVELNAEALGTGEQDLPALTTTLPKLVTLYHGPVLIEPIAGLGWGAAEFVVDASLIPELQEFHDTTGVDHIARLGVLVGLFDTTVGMDMPAFVYQEGSNGQVVGVDFGGIRGVCGLRWRWRYHGVRRRSWRVRHHDAGMERGGEPSELGE